MSTASNYQKFLDTITSPALRAIAECWHQARGTKLMPAWVDLSPSVLSPYLTMIWAFKYDAQTGEFTGRLAGNRIAGWFSPNFRGASLKDLHPPHVFNESHELLTKAVTTPAAGRSSGRLFTVSGHTVTGERIVLPLASDALNADGVLGASDYEYSLMSGPVELHHDNVEWFTI